jgi:uncharacterized protein YjbI with pentapeptide repeats
MARWDWLGLRERRWTKRADEEIRPAKTAWDWLQLLVVPAMLAAIAVGFNASQASREREREDKRLAKADERAEDVRHEQALQSYFDRISDLLLAHRLLRAQKDSAVGQVARNITLATLRGLDGGRKAQAIRFLADAGLIAAPVADDDPVPVVDLADADLSGADFREVEGLDVVSLNGANLRGARFDGVRLREVEFQFTALRDASFRKARLSGGGFDESDLRWTRFDGARLGFVGDTDPVSFREACLTGASFAGARIGAASLEDTEGRGIDLRDARLAPGTSLDGAVLTRVRGRGEGWGVRREHADDARRHPCATLLSFY